MQSMKNLANLLIPVQLLMVIILLFAFGNAPEGNLRVIACDVGQGDAILITNKNTQVLIDGGPDDQVLACLSRHIPFWDREIELVVNTHPQADHYVGLSYVFERYKVGTFLVSGLDSGNKGFSLLKEKVGGQGTVVSFAREGMGMRVGLIYLDILNPTSELLEKFTEDTADNRLAKFTSKRDPNDFSVVLNLKYGDFDAIFTGDIESFTEDNLIRQGRVREVEYIKVPHHGSKNGLIHDFLLATSPEVAVISVGRKNRYGHPSPEIIELLNQEEVPFYRTDMESDVVISTDGKKWWKE